LCLNPDKPGLRRFYILGTKIQSNTTSRVKLVQQMADSITSALNDETTHTETLATIRNKWEASSSFTAFSWGAAVNAAK
jgi:hypothetical protein